MARRPTSSETDAVLSLLIADSEPKRLEAMMAVAREARVLVQGARTREAALSIIQREGVGVLLVEESFDDGRPFELARRAGGCRCIFVTRRPELAERLPAGFERVLVWPFTAEVIGRMVAGG